MTIENLVENIKEFEGYRDKAYLCPSGIPTIGYGRTTGVKLGQTTERAIEDRWLWEEVTALYTQVKSKMSMWGYGCTENQLFALTDFVYNLGLSRLNTLTNGGKRTLSEIAEKIPEYCKAAGETLPGLVKRRHWERELFLNVCGGNYRTADMWLYIPGHENKGLLKFTGYCASTNNVDYAIFVDKKGFKLHIRESEINAFRFVGND